MTRNEAVRQLAREVLDTQRRISKAIAKTAAAEILNQIATDDARQEAGQLALGVFLSNHLYQLGGPGEQELTFLLRTQSEWTKAQKTLDELLEYMADLRVQWVELDLPDDVFRRIRSMIPEPKARLAIV